MCQTSVNRHFSATGSPITNSFSSSLYCYTFCSAIHIFLQISSPWCSQIVRFYLNLFRSQLSQFVSSEDMDEIKRQAAAAAISAASAASVTSVNETNKTGVLRATAASNSAEHVQRASSSPRLVDQQTDGSPSQTNLSRSGSCASVVELTLATRSPCTPETLGNTASPAGSQEEVELSCNTLNTIANGNKIQAKVKYHSHCALVLSIISISSLDLCHACYPIS